MTGDHRSEPPLIAHLRPEDRATLLNLGSPIDADDADDPDATEILAATDAYVRPAPTRRDRWRALVGPVLVVTAAAATGVLVYLASVPDTASVPLSPETPTTEPVPPAPPGPALATTPKRTTVPTPKPAPVRQPPPAAVPRPPPPPLPPPTVPSSSPPSSRPCLPPLTTCTPTPGGIE